jgi:heptosyltransferase-2
VLDLSGTLSFTETFRVLANAELVVTNDTAPLHLALGTRAKVVGLFGPTRPDTYVSPTRLGVATAHVPLYCSPCVHHWDPAPCGGDNQCMKQMSVAQVLRLCCRLLGLPETNLPPIDPPGDASAYYPGLVYTRLQSRPAERPR